MKFPGRWQTSLRALWTLESASFFYLYLPASLFCFGYLKWWIALTVVTALLIGLFLILQRSAISGGRPEDHARSQANRSTRTALTYILIFVGVVYLVAMSGMGGYSYQNPDYGKHNAFLRDFVEYDWPVAYEETGPRDEGGVVSYYLYYYLPAALVGKLFGWNAANHFTAVWGVLGASLAVCWFLRLVGRISVLYALLFFFFGGLDLIGWTLVHGWITDGTLSLDSWLAVLARQTPELRGMWMVYGSTLPLMFWAPHQALAAWIGTGYIMYSIARRKRFYGVFLVWAALILWSPFAALGLLPFLIVMLFRYIAVGERAPKAVWSRFRELVTFPDAAAGSLLLFVQVSFLLASKSTYPSGFLWEFQNLYSAWPTLILFFLIEFGLYAIVCTPLEPNTSVVMKPWIWTALVALLVIPFYRLGLANDFVSRASIPALFVLAVYLATAIERARSAGRRTMVRTIVALLCIGAAPALTLLANAHRTGFSIANIPERDTVQHINELEPKRIADHYFGEPESFFVKYLAAPVKYQSE